VPRFTANAALGGKTFRYSLADALAKGPVVVYFFPAADSATTAPSRPTPSPRPSTSSPRWAPP
jgi:hypothetical protein